MNRFLLQRLQEIMTNSRATGVGIAARRLAGGEEILIDADRQFHPASTVKVCIMMEAYRQTRAGEISLDDLVVIRNEFHSLVDGSPYALDLEDDSEKELYDHIGHPFSKRELIRRMVTVSSNLASNLLLEQLSAERVTALMEALGTQDLKILRGFEDKLAYRQGLNNAATARGFMQILRKLARREVAAPDDSDAMIEILSQQQFNEMIPAGMPLGVRIAHKTGWAADYNHDVGIVFPPGGEPFVLCILTKGYPEGEEAGAHVLVAALSRAIYEEWGKP